MTMKLMSNESHILKHSLYYDADQFVELTNGCRHHFSIVSLNIESINGSFHVKRDDGPRTLSSDLVHFFTVLPI